MTDAIDRSLPARARRYDQDHARRLRALAYRMLGSRAEAEDIVQEGWLRWAEVDESTVQHAGAFLSRLVTNLCLDRLRSAAAQREQYVGVWLPEPLLEDEALFGWAPGPEKQAEFAQDVSVAFMLALERLSPLERAAFLLHDVFDQSFEEVAQRLGRSAAACRQLAARARVHVQGEQVRVDLRQEQAEQLLGAFVRSIVSGDADALAQLLTQDAVMLSDGGGIVTAVAQPLSGAALIAKALIGFAKMWRAQDYQLRFTRINGLPSAVLYDVRGQVLQTTALRVEADGHINAIYVMRNPQKLAHIRPVRPSVDGIR